MFVMRTGRGFSVKRPTRPGVSTALANLRPGESLMLERVVEEQAGDWYIQVWMREGNSFQLEYRDGVPGEQYQTRTVSREKVIAAMLAWMKGTPGWQEPFMWNNIGSWFDGQDLEVRHNPDGTSTESAGVGDLRSTAVRHRALPP